MQKDDQWNNGPDVVEAALLIVEHIDPNAPTLTAGQVAAVQILIDSNVAWTLGNRFTHRVRTWRAAGVVSHARRSYSGQPLRYVALS